MSLHIILVSHLLTAGNASSAVQRRAGHASVTTATRDDGCGAASTRTAVVTLHVPTPQRDRSREGDSVVLYATLCGLLVGLRRIQAALARRHVPCGVITVADVALARARRWCSPHGRRAAPRTRGT